MIPAKFVFQNIDFRYQIIPEWRKSQRILITADSIEDFCSSEEPDLTVDALRSGCGDSLNGYYQYGTERGKGFGCQAGAGKLTGDGYGYLRVKPALKGIQFFIFHKPM